MNQSNKKQAPIEIVSSASLSDKQKAEIEKHSLRIFSLDRADFEYSLDDSLIGGFVVKYKSRVVDLSVNELVESMGR